MISLWQGNFGSKAAYNFSQMQEIFDEYGKKWPHVEFWMVGSIDGKNQSSSVNLRELAEAVHEVLEQGELY